AAPEGDHRRMFEQEKLVGDGFLLPQLHELLLQPHAVLVRDEMEVAKLADAHRVANTQWGSEAFPNVAPARSERRRPAGWTAALRMTVDATFGVATACTPPVASAAFSRRGRCRHPWR